MLSVLRVHLPSDIPIVGCELTPYVLLRRPNGTITSDDVPETAPVDGFYLKYVWFRIQSDPRVAVCNVHPSEPATLQCIGCIKAKTVNKSYHCSPDCFADSWRQHRSIHARAASAMLEKSQDEDESIHARAASAMFEKSQDEDELFGSYNCGSTTNSGLSNGSLVTVVSDRSGGGETWFEVGRSRTYTPITEDVGHVLKFECTAIEVCSGQPMAPASTLLTARVIPAPSPTPRRMISISAMDGLSGFNLDARLSTGTFTVLSYNVLADLYATNEMYSYCPPWALSWSYRRQNLLREIVGYRADVLCLQEVQSDHFEEFFAPELEKHGYMAVYKKKTTEVYTGNAFAIDGCATFFRRDRFSLVKKYEVEFNKAAQSLTESVIPPAQRKLALGRLLKDNVALIVVLEARDSSHEISAPGKRQLLCVANTHINANPELKDVKLWQVQTLLKGLEKIAASADIPMLMCGDFNSTPGSAPHVLLASGRVDPTHPDLMVDPLGILRPTSRLCHQLPLVSAYSSFARLMGGPSVDQYRHLVDLTTDEPVFTNCTRDFLGTLDYIFYTADYLAVESLLELLDEDSLRRDTALPSPEWSSDHIALLAQFRYKPRPLR